MNELTKQIETHLEGYNKVIDCTKFTYKLLLESKAEIERLESELAKAREYVPMTNEELFDIDIDVPNKGVSFDFLSAWERVIIQRANLIVKEYTMSNELRLEALVRYDKDDNGVIDVHADFELMEALRDELANPQPKSQIRADFLVRTEKELKMLEKFGGGHELGFTQRLLRDYKHVLPNLMTVDDVITHLENTGYVVVQAKKWHALQDKHEAVLNDDTHDNDCTHDVVDCLSPIPDFADVFTSEDFENEETLGSINSDDGHGYWATAGSESKLSVWSPKPEWATHVTWYNK